MSVIHHTRDLRCVDHMGQQKKAILPLFIFIDHQIQSSNPYFSNNSVQFLCESLRELYQEYAKLGHRLFILHVSDYHSLHSLHSFLSQEEIEWTIMRDYTPYARKRVDILNDVLKRPIREVQDTMLIEPDDINALNKQKKPYKVFTPYYNKVKKYIPNRPELKKHKATMRSIQLQNRFSLFLKENDIRTLTTQDLSQFYTPNPSLGVTPGRRSGLSILKKLPNIYGQYHMTRNDLTQETSRLSAHLKYGTISIREAYHAGKTLNSKSQELFIRQLYWRNFYYSVAFHFPFVLKGQLNFNLNRPIENEAFIKSFKNLRWNVPPSYEPYSKKSKIQHWWDTWCTGHTGFPIVDAGMREMNQTGFMHNRTRMITTSFLSKDLLIDWRYGERYFAQHLVDYDPMNNNGGHQWSGSVGTDSQPYFRIFNPWLQSKKFDPHCEYIRKWIPELTQVDPKDIHQWYDPNMRKKYDRKNVHYPDPIVNHSIQKEKTILFFKSSVN